MTTAPARQPLVRNVYSRSAEAHVPYATGFARALGHEAAPVAVMVWVVVTGHEAVTMMAAALTLALLSFGYAPLARTRVWAREHLADLWAMLLLMAVMALGRAEPTFPNTGNIDSARLASGHGHGMGGAGAGIVGLSGLAAIALVAGWALARVLIARRGWHTRSLVSAAVCGAGLLWMLLL